MDIVTKSYLDEFASSFNLSKLDETRQFEHFANYIVVGNQYDNSRFQVMDISTGKNAPGIDGVAIIVNNRLCLTANDVKLAISYAGKLEVDFIFIQSKITNSFSGTDIESFFNWTKRFFSFKKNNSNTQEMNNFIDIAHEIYKNSRYFIKSLPTIKLYYACTGKWSGLDENLNDVVYTGMTELDGLDLFSKVDFEPCDVKKIQALYIRTKQPNEATINIENKIKLPAIKDVTSAMYAVLPFNEFKELIIDEHGKIKNVFEDNIRGFLGVTNNGVNEDILKTISEGKAGEFCLLNNGVTVIAEKIIWAGDKITLQNYQIVNGCQTSNVLYECRGIAGIENVFVPVKIVETQNKSIQVEVTRATNNQTQVGIEQLESLTEYQHELEMYYVAVGKQKENPLYYERRTNQFRGDMISPTNIVDIENQIKTFASMFVEKPHIVSGYYSKLFKDLGNEIFNISHKPIGYYTSALAFRRVIELFNEGVLDSKLWRFRYHIIMVLKYAVNKKRVPHMNGKDFEQYCKTIIDVIENREKSQIVFLEIQDMILSLDDNIKVTNRKSSEKRATTEKILEEAGYVYLGYPRRFPLF